MLFSTYPQKNSFPIASWYNKINAKKDQNPKRKEKEKTLRGKMVT